MLHFMCDEEHEDIVGDTWLPGLEKLAGAPMAAETALPALPSWLRGTRPAAPCLSLGI